MEEKMKAAVFNPVILNEGGKLTTIKLKSALKIARIQNRKSKPTARYEFDSGIHDTKERNLYFNLMNPIQNSAYFNNHCFIANRNCERCRAKDRCIESKVKEVQND
jgi:hypothetical protein